MCFRNDDQLPHLCVQIRIVRVRLFVRACVRDMSFVVLHYMRILLIFFRCYQAGLKLEPLNLFPLAPFPVPHGTPMVSPHIKWDHSQEWKVARHVPLEKDVERGCTFDIDLSKDSADHFLVDHTIDGRTVFPGAGYFVLTWRAIAKREGKPIEEVPVMFEDVKIHKAAILSEKRMTFQYLFHDKMFLCVCFFLFFFFVFFFCFVFLFHSSNFHYIFKFLNENMFGYAFCQCGIDNLFKWPR